MKRKKDILIICQFFYPEYVSSATLPTDLALDLAEYGFSVDVLCGYPQEYYKGLKNKRLEKYKGVLINRVRYLQFQRNSTMGRIVNYASLCLSMAFRSFKLLSYKCVLVYSNPPLIPIIPAIYSKLFRTSFVFVAYDIDPDISVKLGFIKKGAFVDKCMSRINEIVYKYAEKVVALSNDMKRYILESGLTTRPEQIEIIPNWYDDSNIDLSTNVKNSDFAALRSTYRFIALYSGNMGICQDMDTIVKSISLIGDRSDILFIFTGHGCKVDELKQYVKTNDLKNVKFYGFLSGSDYSDILKIADCYLVSLAKGIEGMGVPSKTYSYLAVGRPIIAIMARKTDIAEMIEKYSAGHTVEQNDINKLAEILLGLSRNPSKCIFMGRNARKAYEDNYMRGLCTHSYIKMFNSILNKPQMEKRKLKIASQTEVTNLEIIK